MMKEVYMIFHVIAQHDHSTCNRVKEGPGFAKSGMTWVEGNDKVNILGVWGYPVSHRVFSVVEADTFEDVESLFDFHLGMGPVEVLPVKDLVQLRKDQGFWGTN
jgi:hypothetical protein